MKPVVSSLFALSFLVSSATPAMSDALSDATKVAQAGYKEFLRIPLQQKDFCAGHGLTKLDTQSAITLGNPFRLHSMTPGHIRSYQAGTPVSRLTEKTNIYMFPVLFDGQAKLFLNVCKFNKQKFEIGSLGESQLCKEISNIEAQYQRSEGYTLQLIQNFQTHRYLFHIPQVDQENLTLIESKPSPERNYRQLSSSAKSMEHMKALLEEMMN